MTLEPNAGNLSQPSDMLRWDAAATKYLTTLFKQDDRVCLTFIHQTETDSTGQALVRNHFHPLRDVITPDTLNRLKTANTNWHVYVSMAVFQDDTFRRLKTNIKEVRHVFMEDDNGAALAQVRAAVALGELPPPTVVVESSPGRNQFAWNVEGFTIEQQERLNKTFVQKFGSDKMAVDAARVLRIPGFKNIKPKYNNNGEYPAVALLEVNPDGVYQPKDFNLPTTEPAATKETGTRPTETAEKGELDKRFAALSAAVRAAVGYAPLIARMQKLAEHYDDPRYNVMDSRHHNAVGLQAGVTTYCPIPSHGVQDKTASYSRCFGPIRDNPDVFFCQACGWSGDVIKACYEIDQELHSGGVRAKFTMYNMAEVIAAEAGLDYKTFFPESQPRQPFVQTGSESSGLASDVKMKPVRWIWKNRFAVKLNILCGNPDVAKSLIALYIVAQVTTGKPWFDSPNIEGAGEALVLAAEDDWDDTVAPRLAASGADMTKVHWLKMSVDINGQKSERELQLDSDMQMLERFLANHPQIRVVVVDPVSNYLGNTKMVDEQGVRRVLTPLKELANRLGVAIICVMHLNKKVDLDAIHRVGGAMAFVGVARMVWLCAPKPTDDGESSDEMVMVKVKGNIVQRQLKGLSYITKARGVEIEGKSEFIPYVEWKGEVNQQASDLTARTGKKESHRPPVARQAAVDWLKDYLKDGPRLWKDILKTGEAVGGLSKSTLIRVKHSMGIETFKSGEEKARDGKMRDVFSCRLPVSETLDF